MNIQTDVFKERSYTQIIAIIISSACLAVARVTNAEISISAIIVVTLTLTVRRHLVVAVRVSVQTSQYVWVETRLKGTIVTNIQNVFRNCIA